jgi:hypothetical protein
VPPAFAIVAIGIFLLTAVVDTRQRRYLGREPLRVPASPSLQPTSGRQMNTRSNATRSRLGAGIAVILAIAMLAFGQIAFAAGPAPVGLGTAKSFAVLAGTGITNTGATTINGDVGSFPTATETGFATVVLTGTNHHGDAVTQGAKADLTTAYNDAAGRTPATAVAGGTLGGKTLVGGVYNAGGVTLDLTGTLTLNGQNDPNSVWIFQATSDLVTASSSNVHFINGGQPCNVFWQVTSSATLGSGSHFIGTIMALTSISMNAGVQLNGRALARNGDVTLINDVITRPGCSATTASPSASGSVPNAALGGSGQSEPRGAVLFVLALIGLLGILVTANARRACRNT